jgi:hypothetical protein
LVDEPLLTHEAVPRCGTNQVVCHARVETHRRAERHRLARERDLHRAENLVDELEVARRANNAANDAELAVRLASKGVEDWSGGLDGFSGAGSHDGELALSSAGGTTRHGRVADPDALAQGVKTLLNGDEEAWWDCGEANDRSTGFED